MLDLFETLATLENLSGRNAKRALLEQNVGDETLMRYLRLAFDPYLDWGVAKLPKLKPGESDDLTSFMDLLEHELAPRKLSGNAAKAAVAEKLGELSELAQLWAGRLLLKNPRLGVQVKTVNDVFPGLITEFKVALAEKFDGQIDPDGRFVEGRISLKSEFGNELFVEPKLDGLRLLASRRGSKVVLRTRNGNEVTSMPELCAGLSALPGDWDLDGEVMGEDWAESASIVMSSVNKKDEARLTYHVFDLPSHSGAFEDRRTALEVLVAVLSHPRVKLVRSVRVRSSDTAQLVSLYEGFLNEGYEGAMLKSVAAPYQLGRSRAIMKWKPVATEEGVIIDAYEGRPGTKHEGKFGGITVLFQNGVTTNVGSGFNDAFRDEANADPAALVGRIVECEHQPPFTPDGKLRFPTFVRFRSPVDVDVGLLEAVMALRPGITFK